MPDKCFNEKNKSNTLMICLIDDKNLFGGLLPGGEGLLAKGEKPTFSWKRDGQPFDPEERFKVLSIYLTQFNTLFLPIENFKLSSNITMKYNSNNVFN